MRYAEVSVNSPVAQHRSFSYAIPEGMGIKPGQAVLVPFGERVLQGIVIELTALPAVEDTKEILSIIDPEPILSPAHIKLAQWISQYYLSPLFDAVALMLPPGFERKAIAFIRPTSPPPDFSDLDETQRQVMEIIRGREKVGVSQIEKALGKRKAAAAITKMIQQHFLKRSYELSGIKVKPKTELFIKVNPAAPP